MMIKQTLYISMYNFEDLLKIIETQTKITNYMKQQKKTKMFNVLVIVADFADNPSFCRNSKLLHALYTRGRHACLSTILTLESNPVFLLGSIDSDPNGTYLRGLSSPRRRGSISVPSQMPLLEWVPAFAGMT